MKLPFFNPKSIRKYVYIFFTILPAVVTGSVYQNVTDTTLTSSSFSSIDALGNTIFSTIEKSVSTLSYSLKVLTTSYEFTHLDHLGMANQINLYQYYNPRICKNMYVLSPKFETIYGVNDNLVSHISYNTHITSALQGTPTYYYVYEKRPYVQIAYPIFSPTQKEVIGVLVATLDFSIFDSILANIPAIDSKLHVYLIDSNGIITSSSDTINSNDQKPIRMDIDKIKYTLSYSPTSSFTDLDGKDIYGAYFNLPEINATLLVTTHKPDSYNKFMDYLGYILGILSATTITTTEALRKRKGVVATSQENNLEENIKNE